MFGVLGKQLYLKNLWQFSVRENFTLTNVK